jgi:hypothetical protein
MPGEPVTVEAVFDFEFFLINISRQYYNGRITFEDGNGESAYARAGDIITLVADPAPGFYLNYIKAVGRESKEQLLVSEVPGEPNMRTFIMPWETVDIPDLLNGAEFLEIEP